MIFVCLEHEDYCRPIVYILLSVFVALAGTFIGFAPELDLLAIQRA